VAKRSCKPLACSDREESAITQIPYGGGHLGETRNRLLRQRDAVRRREAFWNEFQNDWRLE
jgi:hypothetical protein